MSFDSEQAPLTPEWLTSQFLEENFKNHYKNNEIRVISFEVKPVSASGGYMSSMYRVTVSFDTPLTDESSPNNHIKALDLIVKIAASDGTVNTFSNYDIYDREIQFYCEIIPKFEDKLKALGAPQLLPKCFGVCKTRKVMIMEDLVAKGYKMLPAQPGYDLLQAKSILKTMATFHAVGAALQQEQPNIFANFKSGHLSRDVDVFNNMYAGNLDALIDTISMWPDFSVYAEKLQHLRKDIIERWRKTYDVNPNHFNTLVHDDLWPTNIMLKGEVEPFDDVVFIDFQLCFWSSPTIDLYFFLNTSVCDTLRPHCFDELVEFYHKHLVIFLQQLEYKNHIPTWTEFQAQYQDRKLLAFITSCLEQPITIDSTGEEGIDDLLRNDEKGIQSRRKLYEKPKAQEILRKMIPFYDQIGTFD